MAIPLKRDIIPISTLAVAFIVASKKSLLFIKTAVS